MNTFSFDVNATFTPALAGTSASPWFSIAPSSQSRTTPVTSTRTNDARSAGDSATLTGNSVVRVELTNSAPDTVVTYNVFGDAVLNKDVAGNYQHKAYDRPGRVIYEVDALNQVTEHRYDVFGNETSLIRYAGALNLAAPAPALTPSNVWDAAQIAAHLPVQASLDRTVTTQYDRLNRAIQVTQPSVHNFLPNTGSVAGGTTPGTWPGMPWYSNVMPSGFTSPLISGSMRS